MNGYIGPDGKYTKGKKKGLNWDVNSTWKSWDHDQQRRQYSAEITQPYKGGQPNAKFIRAYPDVAKEYWSQEVIDKTLREGLAE